MTTNIWGRKNTKQRYKFLREGLKSQHRNFIWEIGKWYKIDGELDICNNGFHCSKKIGEAFSYVQGEILAEVEVRGKSIVQDDKEAWEEMRIVKAWHWKKENSVAIAIYAAQLVIPIYEKEYPNDTRPRDAIQAAINFLENPSNDNEAKASAEAAARAAWAAVWTTEAAAEAAARAAEAAAEAAARAAETVRAAASAASAEWAASAAAWAAETVSAAVSAAEIAWAAAIKKIYKRFDQELLKLTAYDR